VERRRDARFPAQLPVVLQAGKATQKVVTWEVSYRGMFLVTDKPPGERMLVKVDIELPDGLRLVAPAMVVWARPKDESNARPAGVGLQFYGIGRDESAIWQRFVNELKEEARRRPFQPLPLPTPDPEHGRRRHGRHVATFKIRPRSLARLHEMYTRDISRGGMFIVTDQLIPVGESIKVDVVHPDTHETFVLVCVVRRAMRDPGRTGLGVEFVDLDEDRRVLFQGFIESGAAGE
jgi:Tfp pilus assembly protein PilZ